MTRAQHRQDRRPVLPVLMSALLLLLVTAIVAAALYFAVSADGDIEGAPLVGQPLVPLPSSPGSLRPTRSSPPLISTSPGVPLLATAEPVEYRGELWFVRGWSTEGKVWISKSRTGRQTLVPASEIRRVT